MVFTLVVFESTLDSGSQEGGMNERRSSRPLSNE